MAKMQGYRDCELPESERGLFRFRTPSEEEALAQGPIDFLGEATFLGQKEDLDFE